MDKPADGRGNTGSTDGIKAGGDAGNERHGGTDMANMR